MNMNRMSSLVLLCAAVLAVGWASGVAVEHHRVSADGANSAGDGATNRELPPIVREGAWLTLVLCIYGRDRWSTGSDPLSDRYHAFQVLEVAGQYVKVQTPTRAKLGDDVEGPNPTGWIHLPDHMRDMALREATPGQIARAKAILAQADDTDDE